MGIRDAGVEDFVIVTGYLGNMIQEAFGDGHRFGEYHISAAGKAVRNRSCIKHHP